MGVLKAVLVLVPGLLANPAALAAENLALRQKLNALQRSAKRLGRSKLAGLRTRRWQACSPG